MPEGSKKGLVISILIVILLSSLALWYFKFMDPGKMHPKTKAVLSKVPVVNTKLKNHEEISDVKRREKLLADEWSKLNQIKADVDKDKDEIAKKEVELEKRRMELDEIEKELVATQEKLNSTLKNIKQLTRYYEFMEPKTAAEILGTMDNEFIIQLFKNMKMETVSEILSLLDTKKAAAITQKMSGL